MSKAVKDVPTVSFRRPKSLGDYLVHAKLKPALSEENPMGTVKSTLFGDRVRGGT